MALRYFLPKRSQEWPIEKLHTSWQKSAVNLTVILETAAAFGFISLSLLRWKEKNQKEFDRITFYVRKQLKDVLSQGIQRIVVE